MTTPDTIFKNDIAELNLDGENVYKKIFLPCTILMTLVIREMSSRVFHV